MCGVLLAESIARTKVAIYVCNHPQLKSDVLCAPGSDYNVGAISSDKNYRKRRWNDVIQRKAAVILENLGLPHQLIEMVISTIFLVGKRMLAWAIYHERVLRLEREYSVNFLNSSFFTPLGIINNKKAAGNMINDDNLSIKQKYQLACLYCFTDHISALYEKIPQEDFQMFYDAENPNAIHQPKIVKFWSYYVKGDLNKLKGERNLEKYFLELAVDSGSQAAVEYYLETGSLRNLNAKVAAAVETVKYRRQIYDDWHVFQNTRYHDNEYIWVPTEYYADILYFLLFQMSENEKKDFLKKDIRGDYIGRSEYDQRYRALEYFLLWPYHNYFLEFAKRMLENSLEECYAFPEQEFSGTLVRICDRIETEPGFLNFGEEKICNYRDILKEFWQQSPERFKKYIFVAKEEVLRTKRVFPVKTGVDVLIKLLKLPNFTAVDNEMINLILTSATVIEKEHIMNSEEWRSMCIDLVERQKWKILDRLELKCFLSKDKTDRFKRELSFTKEVQSICTKFALSDNWNEVDSFMRWSNLSEEEINKLKKEIIHSQEGRVAFLDIITNCKNVEDFDKFVRWCFSSEEERKVFKKELVFSSHGISSCATLIKGHQLKILNKFTNCCLSSQEDIKLLQKYVVNTSGIDICMKLILGYPDYSIAKAFHLGGIRYRNKFERVNWEDVDEFLTWCFSCEEEKNDFKKNMVFKECGKAINCNFTTSCQWEEAENFYSWVGLSAEETKKLKMETLCNDYGPVEMLKDVMDIEDEESKQDAIKRFLKWFITDKETVLEFKDLFNSWLCRQWTEEEKIMLREFEMAIEERISHLEKEKSE